LYCRYLGILFFIHFIINLLCFPFGEKQLVLFVLIIVVYSCFFFICSTFQPPSFKRKKKVAPTSLKIQRCLQ
jgi:hypothetical protein